MSDDRYGVWVVTEGWSRESGVDWIGTFEQAMDRDRALFTGTATYVDHVPRPYRTQQSRLHIHLDEVGSRTTIDGVCAVIASIASECLTEWMSDATDGDAEGVRLLRDCIGCADRARNATLDLSVAMSRYVSHCLERDEPR